MIVVANTCTKRLNILSQRRRHIRHGRNECDCGLTDRAYDGDALREAPAERGAWGNIKPVPQRVDHLQTVPLSLRQSERFFSKLKRFKAVATRFEKHDANCRSPYPQVYAPLDQDDFLRLLIFFQISSVSLVWKDNLFSRLMDTL
jgi:transposase